MKKLKPTFKLAEDFLGLRTAETNAVVEQLEENMRLREMPIEKHIRRLSRKTSLQ